MIDPYDLTLDQLMRLIGQFLQNLFKGHFLFGQREEFQTLSPQCVINPEVVISKPCIFELLSP